MAKTRKKGEHDIPSHIMDDLCSRFVINSDRKHDPIQIFYIMESAHWHYIDFYCMQMQPPPPKCNHKAFSRHMFTYVGELNHFLTDFDNLYQRWQEKKRSIPSYGGILLSTDYTHVLMVQGYTNKASWGFPKGKLEVGESGMQCALREIEEETGLDVRDKICEEASIPCWIQERYHKLYIIPDIALKADIQAKLRREIKAFKWIPVEVLPMHKNDTVTQQVELEPSNFFNVIPFVRPLRKWIEEQQGLEQQAMPASQFTAKGRRRGKAKDTQRRQGPPGPDGDAPTTREGRNSRQSHAAKNLGEQFSAMPVAQAGQHGKQVKILAREGDMTRGTGSRADHHQPTDCNTGSKNTTDEAILTDHGRLRLDEFHSKAMFNFKFDKMSILDVFNW